MTTPTSRNAQATVPASSVPLPKRRQLVVGAGVAAGAALAATAVGRQVAAPAAVAQAAADATRVDGYRLTDHVRRYYETTRT